MIDVDEMGRYRDDEIMILTTGSQGEPMAGLSRMATNNHRTIEITPNDTIIISATRRFRAMKQRLVVPSTIYCA